MTVGIPWNCDFCGKPGLIFSKAGILYCRWCRMSYGEQPIEERGIRKKVEEIMSEVKKE